jgi:hypothetical protein
MAKKKKTLVQQYDEQVRRIENRLQQLAAEGYDVVSEWDSTKHPKRPTRQQVDALKKVTPAKLRKRAVNNVIAVGKRVTNTPAKSTREKVARKEAARKKAETEAIEQGKIILQNLYEILSLPYSANLSMKPETYYEKVATAQSLLDNAIASETEETILKRLAEASEEIITAVEGYIYGSDGSSGDQISYSWMLQILYGDGIPDSEKVLATELEDYDINVISDDEDEEGDDTHLARPVAPKSNIAYNSATDTYIDTKTGEGLFFPQGNGKWLNVQTGEIVFEYEIMR